MLSLSIYILSLCLFLHVSAEPALSDKFTPSQSQQIIMQTSQYHFVPSGSSLQFSLAGWQEGTDSKFIDKSNSHFTQSLSLTICRCLLPAMAHSPLTTSWSCTLATAVTHPIRNSTAM